MSFSDGDFVKIQYNLWRASDGELIQTTDRKLAEEKGIYKEDRKYVPQLVVVGKGNLLKSIDAVLKEMKIGEEKKIELEAKDAYGERSKDLVQVMPLSEFKKRDMDPYPGMQVDLDGTIATVVSVNSSRVMVDANHPLAGQKLAYEIKVVEKVEKESEKIKALAESYDLSVDGVEASPETVKVRFGTEIKKDADYFLNKSRFTAAVMEYMPGVKKVVVEEEYAREKSENSKN